VGDPDIRVSLYVGAYGPTLRIDMQSQAHVTLVRALLASLAEGQQSAARVVAGGPWAFDGLNELALAVDVRAPQRARVVAGATPQDTRVDWRMSADGWQHCLGLLEGLEGPGHQYLTEERKGCLLIELALRERRPAAE
jgi:hypothetical protein